MNTATQAERGQSLNASPGGARALRLILWAIWLLAAMAGTVGLAERLTAGHLPAGYNSFVPWGLWVALYFHGVGIAGGAFATGAAGYLLGLDGFRTGASLRLTIAVAMAAIVPAFIGIWLDIGHLERAHLIFAHPHFTSMMAFNAWMYGVFVVLAAICWFLSWRDRSGWLKPLLLVALLFSVLFPSQSGAFFGVVGAKAFWHSALLPMLFLTSAITSGAATLLVVRSIVGLLRRAPVGKGSGIAADDDGAALGRLRRVTTIGLVIYFAFEFAELSIELWSPHNTSAAVDLLLWGPYWWVFWIVHLFVGGVAAFSLLVGRRTGCWMAGAVLVAVCFVSARLNVLVPGQAVGELRGLQEAFSHPRLRYVYHATTMEYLVGLLLLALAMTVFFLGSRVELFWARRMGGTPASSSAQGASRSKHQPSAEAVDEQA